MFNHPAPLSQTANLRERQRLLYASRASLDTTEYTNQCLLLLWEASAVGDQTLVRDLIRENKIQTAGLCVPQPSKTPPTPLMAAIEGNHRDTIKTLLDHKADVNQDFPFSPLHLAIKNKHIHADTVKLLLERKATITYPPKKGSRRKRFTPLLLAISNEREELIQILLDRNEDVNQHHPAGSPLMLAMMRHNKEIVKVLLEKKANVKEMEKHAVWKPLYFMDNTEIVQMLLDAGADPNSASAGSNRTPLTQAIINNKKDLVKMLLARGANVKQEDRCGDTPLRLAVKSEKSDAAIVEWLLNAESKPDLVTENISTLVKRAVQGFFSQASIVKESRAPQPVFTIDEISLLLEDAVKNKNSNKDVVELLLDKKPAVIPKDRRDALYQHINALLTYIVNDEKSNENIFQRLLKEINILQKDVYSLLVAAFQNKNHNEMIVKILLSYIYSLPDTKNYTLLVHAVKNGKDNSVETLLTYNPTLSQTEIYTLLTHALNTKHNNEKVVEIFLSRSAPLSAEDNYKLLEPAVNNGKENSVKMLLSYKPKLTQQQIHTLLIHAVKNEQGNENIVKLLLDHMQTAIQNNEYDDTPLEPKPPQENKNGHKNLVNASLDLTTDVDLESKKGHKNIVNTLGDLSTDVTLESKNSHENVITTLLDLSADATLESKNSHENVITTLLDLSTDATLESKNSHEKVINMLINLPTDVPLKDTSHDTSLSSVAQRQWVDETQGDTKEAPLPEEGINSQSRKENIIRMLLNAPLYHAVSHLNSNEKIVEALLEAKASVLQTIDSKGTPLEVRNTLPTQPLHRFFDANRPSLRGDTLLMEAIKKGHPKIVELLLAHKADPNQAGLQNTDNMPLNEAISQGKINVSIVKMLLYASADVHYTSARAPHDTPLARAIKSGRADIEILESLIIYGASVDSNIKSLAKEFGQEEILQKAQLHADKFYCEGIEKGEELDIDALKLVSTVLLNKPTFSSSP